ncbi:zinc finger protein 35-like isoform X2 [Ornithodoros turicata]|uniref:zinc finger protein 35-like isoform X2 n=1 Tax=Ornithodoros turicata TaxID=34597 RepID=UPI003138C479
MPCRCSLLCCRAVQNRADNVTFHRLPGEAKRRQRRDWIRIIRSVNGEDWEPAVGTRICGRHFVTEAIVVSTLISINDKPVDSTLPALQSNHAKAEELLTPDLAEQSTRRSATSICIKKEPTDSCGLPGNDDNTEELITGDLPDPAMALSTCLFHIKKEPIDIDYRGAEENCSDPTTHGASTCYSYIKKEPAHADSPDLVANSSDTRGITSEHMSETTLCNVLRIKQEPCDTYDSSSSSDSPSLAAQSKPGAGIGCERTKVTPKPLDHTALQEQQSVHQNHGRLPDTSPELATPVSLKCSICSTAFLLTPSLKTLLNTRARVLMCSSCFASFVKQRCPAGQATEPCSDDLHSAPPCAPTKLKILLETGQTPHKCARCPARFVSRCDLIHHMRTHTIGNLFRCEFCPALYGTSAQLERHLSKHMTD